MAKAKKASKKTAKATTRQKATSKPKAGAPPEETTPVQTPEPGEDKAPAKKKSRATAESMARMQRDISVAEFFTKNRHLLGFDNPRKALLTTIKEGVDNSLDACEEADILPEVTVEIKPAQGEDRFRVTIEDNGPGILKNQIPKIFAKLLYGSKFHRLKMSRGQQGIGISAAGMYGQLTTGKPIAITSRTNKRRPAHHYELEIDTKKNQPRIITDETVEWEKDQGTKVEIELEAKFQKGKQSVEEYLEQTAIANPHVQITFVPPNGEKIVYPRAAEELPAPPKEIKPHPYGIELGMLIKMMHETKSRTLSGFLQSEFSRVSKRVAQQICEGAKVKDNARPSRIARQEADALFKAINATKIMNPPTDCVSPIGEELIVAGLKKQIDADFYTAVTRPPAVYRGNPFQIEAGLAFGGSLGEEGLARVLRYANRVPLLYQQSACAISRSVISTAWRNYHVQQSSGALPSGPLVIMVHMASVWVPFTSESKEAIAHYPEIIKQVKLALQECGRKLSAFLSRRRREAEAARKRDYIKQYIPHIAIALQEMLDLTDRQKLKVTSVLTDTLERSRK